MRFMETPDPSDSDCWPLRVESPRNVLLTLLLTVATRNALSISHRKSSIYSPFIRSLSNVEKSLNLTDLLGLTSHHCLREADQPMTAEWFDVSGIRYSASENIFISDREEPLHLNFLYIGGMPCQNMLMWPLRGKKKDILCLCHNKASYLARPPLEVCLRRMCFFIEVPVWKKTRPHLLNKHHH